MANGVKTPGAEKASQTILDAHKRLVVPLAVSTLMMGLPFLGLMLWLYSTGKGPTVMVVVMLGGALGAFVSALERLYAFQAIRPDKSYARMFFKLDLYTVVYSIVPALVGTIGAAFVYVVFAGGLVAGPLFPEFPCLSGDNCDSFAEFVRYWSPVGRAD